MWIHLLALRLIDGAGGEPVPPTPSEGAGAGGAGGPLIRGLLPPGYPYSREIKKVSKSLDKLISTEVSDDEELDRLRREKEEQERRERREKNAKLDLIAISSLAALESATTNASKLLAEELERQLQLELLEEEELLALALML